MLTVKDVITMRKKGFCFVAVAYGGEASIPNFEKADTFWAYYLSKNKIMRRELLSLYPETNDERIAKFVDSSFDVVIARNFGAKAIARLKEAGLSLYTFDGGCDAAVKAMLADELTEL